MTGRADAFCGLRIGAIGLLLLVCVMSFRAVAEDRQVRDDRALGLPPAVLSRLASPVEIATGRRLFFDQRLSRNGTVSCATCHVPERAFSDGRPLAIGVDAQIGSRKTPSLLNVALETSEFWDGRRKTLEQQALDPIVNPREHGLGDLNALTRLIRHDPEYKRAFERILGVNHKPDATDAAHALASFERTLLAGGSRFDRFQYGGDTTALTEAEQRGLQLFQGRAQCVTCHTIGHDGATFNDGEFHTLGIGFSKIESVLDRTARKVVAADPNELDKLIISDADVAELGRFNVTKEPADIGKFKTPSLRNVALIAPYMHDGSVKTLEDAVEMEVYFRGAEAQHPMILTPLERADIVAFLRSLTSPYATRFTAR
ncbi:cytochrome-c peroxidase [Burkholderia sp. 22PA0099]|uniref:cytochrome-c peroxidase n=1 Tax=Burkholderia sp. 22PA0099 TaxID=3237372 RepID=UPI0039C110DC